MNIVFDIGGTNMRVAVAENGNLGEIKKVPTPQDPNEGISTFVALAQELAQGSLNGLAGCFAGRIDAEGKIHGARNLLEWEGTNLVQAFSNALKAPARILNDAIVVGLGEAKRGGGRGFSRIAYITISTGVGGARIDDDIAESPLLGDLKLQVGDLEDQVSGTAVRRKFGIHPKELESLEERNKLADIFAQGLAEIAKAWTPDVIVLGGSMIVGVNPIPLDRVKETLATLMQNPPEVKMAELGDNGGLIGGLILAEQK